MRKIISILLILITVLSCKNHTGKEEKPVTISVDINEKEVAIDNGVLHLKLDFTRGGAIFLAGMAGAPGFESTDSQTSYIAPLKSVALKKEDVFENDYWLVVGSLDDIRSEIYKINKRL